MDTSSTDTQQARMRRLCHDLKQYVVAGLMLATELDELGPDDGEGPELGPCLVQVLTSMGEMLDVQLHAPEPSELCDVADLVGSCVGVASRVSAVPIRLERPAVAAVSGDAVQLRRAVGNLLDNAVRAAGDGGVVDVRVLTDTRSVRVQVCDDGCGFGRLPTGSGQGYSVVGEVVRAHHGRLAISSGPGPGTTVEVELPLCSGMGESR